MSTRHFGKRLGACIATGLCALIIAMAAGASPAAASDSCREWRDEHLTWKTKAMCRYLLGEPQRELDLAIFEMLQREAYLTSCDSSVQIARGDMVGWRLAGRSPDEYGSAVLESVLERAGFDVGLRSLFEVDSRSAVASTTERRRFPASGAY